MAKRKKKAASPRPKTTSRPIVGSLSLAPPSKRKKTSPDTAPPDSNPPSPFWKLPAEIRNRIYELAYHTAEPVKVVPKRPRSKTQKAHKVSSSQSSCTSWSCELQSEVLSIIVSL